LPLELVVVLLVDDDVVLAVLVVGPPPEPVAPLSPPGGPLLHAAVSTESKESRGACVARPPKRIGHF
jgi:hypothetical protein